MLKLVNKPRHPGELFLRVLAGALPADFEIPAELSGIERAVRRPNPQDPTREGACLVCDGRRQVLGRYGLLPCRACCGSGFMPETAVFLRTTEPVAPLSKLVADAAAARWPQAELLGTHLGDGKFPIYKTLLARSNVDREHGHAVYWMSPLGRSDRSHGFELEKFHDDVLGHVAVVYAAVRIEFAVADGMFEMGLEFWAPSSSPPVYASSIGKVTGIQDENGDWGLDFEPSESFDFGRAFGFELNAEGAPVSLIEEAVSYGLERLVEPEETAPAAVRSEHRSQRERGRQEPESLQAQLLRAAPEAASRVGRFRDRAAKAGGKGGKKDRRPKGRPEEKPLAEQLRERVSEAPPTPACEPVAAEPPTAAPVAPESTPTPIPAP